MLEVMELGNFQSIQESVDLLMNVVERWGAGGSLGRRRVDPWPGNRAVARRQFAGGSLKTEIWLGGRDSNPDSTVQSRVSYH